MEIPDIKTRLSILTLLNKYNIPLDKHHKVCCPFHQEKTPSLVIYPQTNTWHCFGCGKSGDQIEFIELFEKCTKHEAILKAQNFIGQQPAPTLQPKTIPEKPLSLQERTAILTRIFESFKNGLTHPMSLKPKEYLRKRNLYIEPKSQNSQAAEMGYNSGQFHHRGSLNETDKQACIKAGLLIPYKGTTPNGNADTFTPFAKDCIIFPLKDHQNQIVSFYGRSIQENADGTGKHFYLKDRTGLYPGYPAVGEHSTNAETTRLILTEAIIDAATLLINNETLVINNEMPKILACYGTNGLTNEHMEAIKELQNLEEIIFFFDGDNPGREGAAHHAETLHNLLPNIKISHVDTPEGEDVNSLLQGHEPAIFTHLIENRRQFENLKMVPFENENTPEPVKTLGTLAHGSTSKLNTTNLDYITYTTEELQITIIGGINLQQLDRLRITIKITSLAHQHLQQAAQYSIRHTLDLYHSDYLEKFIGKASEQLEISTSIIKRAIAELTEQIEAYRLSKIESQKEQKPLQRQLTDQRRQRAMNYLKAPNLLQRTNDDIGKTGVIGESGNRLLMYLVFTSRLRELPLHIVSLGASGTGKTYLQEKVSELIPEQDKLEITILTENAFYYFDRKELKHKLVLIEDMDGAQEVLYPLRELQTKRKISKTVPIKDNKGNLRTITLHVEGPICLAGTTTKEKLYEDNANRSLLIYLDNSTKHKELIMDYQRRASAGKIDIRQERDLIEFFKDMQSILKPIKIRNPFAEYLKLPEHVFKPLRTNAHYLAFIETITFYHQYQREVKTDTNSEQYIETTLEDIEWANKLLKDVLLAKSDELTGAERSFFESLKNWMKDNHKTSFYAKEIRDVFRMHPSKVKRYLYGLTTYNMVKITGGNRFKNGFEYEVVTLDDYSKLESFVNTVLDNVLNEIKQKVSGSGGLPVVYEQNRPRNQK